MSNNRWSSSPFACTICHELLKQFEIELRAKLDVSKPARNQKTKSWNQTVGFDTADDASTAFLAAARHSAQRETAYSTNEFI